MFNRNDPAGPAFVEKEDDNVDYLYGFTKFEQCAKDFTAAALPHLLVHYENLSNGKGWQVAEHVAVEIGLETAEEFCRQMEEREK